MVQHVISGLRIGGSDLRAEWLEVSLLRLLHGDNGRMIKDCYSVYRELCVRFTPRGVSKASDLYDLLAPADSPSADRRAAAPAGCGYTPG